MNLPHLKRPLNGGNVLDINGDVVALTFFRHYKRSD